MYLIGICDDGVNICSFIKKCLLKQAKQKSIQIVIKIYNTGEDLQNFLRAGNRIDILYLDIELFEITGIEVASYIRNQLNDRNMQIIYMSGKVNYAKSLFKTQPMDFLVKPLKPEQISETFNLAIKILSRATKRFEFQCGKNHYYIPYTEIVYFTSSGRIVKIFTVSEEKEFYGKLKEIGNKLPHNFIKIHQSFIVNDEYIRRYTYEMVELADGTQLTISKAYRKQVRQRFLQGE